MVAGAGAPRELYKGRGLQVHIKTCARRRDGNERIHRLNFGPSYTKI